MLRISTRSERRSKSNAGQTAALCCFVAVQRIQSKKQGVRCAAMVYFCIQYLLSIDHVSRAGDGVQDDARQTTAFRSIAVLKAIYEAEARCRFVVTVYFCVHYELDLSTRKCKTKRTRGQATAFRGVADVQDCKNQKQDAHVLFVAGSVELCM